MPPRKGLMNLADMICSAVCRLVLSDSYDSLLRLIYLNDAEAHGVQCQSINNLQIL